jgi:hypothetical protein
VFFLKQERRHHQRAECNLIARIHRASRCFDGLIRNVSDKGVFVCSAQKLLPGECICIAVEPPGCVPLEIDLEVVWSRIFRHDEPGGLYGTGCRFIDVRLMQTATSPTQL